MKKLMYFMMATIFACMTWSCSSENDVEEVVSYDDLPAAAKVFLSTYFPGEEIIHIEKDGENSGAKYDVTFKSGGEVEFNAAGEWIDVDPAFGFAVPSGIVPIEISNYVSNNYPDQYIAEISRSTVPWEIELSNGVEIQFSSTFEVLWVEM